MFFIQTGASVNRKVFTLVFTVMGLLYLPADAQVVISGRVTDAKYHVPLYPATILDTTTGLATYADSTGHYRIEVKGGAVLKYSYLGFYSKIYQVPQRLEYITHDVVLKSKKEKLNAVEVKARTPYQQDSLSREKTFRYYLDQPQTQMLDKSKHSGFGLVFHPLTYFSKAERRKRRFHKMFPHFEKDAFIDSRYTPALVKKLTGLEGDSLRLFMYHHRPDYLFTRQAQKLVFWSWITVHYKAWEDSLYHRSMPK